MNFLDMKTVIFSYLLIHTMCTIVVWALWRTNRQRYAGLSFWLATYALQFSGLTLLLLRGVAPDFISVVASDTLIVAGIVLLREGLGRFLDKKGAAAHDWALLALFAFLQFYFSLQHPSMAARNLSINAILLILSLECVWTLVKDTPPALRHAAKAPALALTALAALSLTRIIYSIHFPIEGNFFDVTGIHALMVMSYLFLAAGLTFGLFLMVNHRLLEDTRSDFEGRIKAEQKLLDNAMQMDLALKSSEMGTWYLDIKEDRRHFDRQVCQLLGIDPDSFTGKPDEFFNVMHPDDRERLKTALAEAIEMNRPYALEYRVITKNGSVRYIAARGRLRRDENGDPWRFDGIIWDVTERRRC